jgi:preprotein translocase subunit SecY
MSSVATYTECTLCFNRTTEHLCYRKEHHVAAVVIKYITKNTHTLYIFACTLQVKYQKYRGQQGTYPIKLFYTSNMPIILQTALVSNLYFLSQLLHNRYSGNIIVRILGRWQEAEGMPGQTVPVGGLAYYISPPTSVSEIVGKSLHSF